MSPARSIVLSSLVAFALVSTLGCVSDADPAVDDDELTRAAEAPAPPGSDVDQENTFHIEIDDVKAFYNSGAYRLGLCTAAFPAATIAKIEKSPNQGEPGSVHLVLQKKDGKWDSRVVNPWPNPPIRQKNQRECKGGEMLFLWLAKTPDAGHLRHVDLAGFFTSSLGGDRFSCEGGFSLSKPIGVDVKGFSFDDGKLGKPELSLTVEGDIAAGSNVSCSASWSKTGIFFAGLVPVVYEVELGVGLALAATKNTHLATTFGTGGGSLKTSSAAFTATPSVALGVTFYGLVGGYVGADFPMKVTPRPGKSCSPEVTMDVTLKAGVEAGLLGVGDLPIAKSVGMEASSSKLGPFVLRACK